MSDQTTTGQNVSPETKLWVERRLTKTREDVIERVVPLMQQMAVIEQDSQDAKTDIIRLYDLLKETREKLNELAGESNVTPLRDTGEHETAPLTTAKAGLYKALAGAVTLIAGGIAAWFSGIGQ